MVNLNITQKGRLNLVRYFSEEEMRVKYERARDEGKDQTYIPPCITQSICREAGAVLVERREEVMDCLMRVKNGEDLDPEETLVELKTEEDGRVLCLKIDFDTLTCHLRRYYYPNNDTTTKLKPTPRGITINCDEMMQVLMIIDRALEEIEAVHVR